ncbi:MAG: Uma2 family endonuclease [Spirulinaceae cyanobacterium]
MTQTPQQSLSLSEFISQPETKPASEYIDGKIYQKPMSGGQHSLIQGELCGVINKVAEPQKKACAFLELQCTFGGYSIVPDIAVFRWSRIPKTETGEIENYFGIAPDWLIEVVSSGHSMTLLLQKLIHCSQQGTSLGWLINVEEETIFVMREEQRLNVFQGEERLPVLEGLDLELTVQEILSWLTFK